MRPSWTDYFFGLAKLVSKRSPDLHTQHGCILTNEKRRIIATGFNGFPRGAVDFRLPLTREKLDERGSKYNWMLHSEINALHNATESVDGATAWITGDPCFTCRRDLFHNGVKKINYVKGYGWQKDDDEAPLKKFLQEVASLEVTPMEPDLTWLVDTILSDPKLKEITVKRLQMEDAL